MWKIVFDMSVRKLEFKNQLVVVRNVWRKKAVATLNAGKIEIGRDGLAVVVCCCQIFSEGGDGNVFQFLRGFAPTAWRGREAIGNNPREFAQRNGCDRAEM